MVKDLSEKDSAAGATAGLPSSANLVPGIHCWTSQTVPPEDCQPDWQSLIESLRSFGVSGADAAIAAAQQRGLPWGEVQELLEEFGQGVPEQGGPARLGAGGARRTAGGHDHLLAEAVERACASSRAPGPASA